MRPSLGFAGYVPGKNNGSSSGIIATSFRWRARVSDSAQLLTAAASPHWRVGKKNKKTMRQDKKQA